MTRQDLVKTAVALALTELGALAIIAPIVRNRVLSNATAVKAVSQAALT